MELTVASLGGDRHCITIRGHELIVDQPRDAGGEDAGPTPTDLFVASLASCVAHYARRGLGSGGEGPKVRCVWRMSETPPWRVAAIRIDVLLPPGTTDARLAAVRRAVEHCTVHNSLQAPPAVSITTTAALSDVGAGLRGGVLHSTVDDLSSDP
ncbi:MAG: OsmC family protein [Candidatus Dormibacteria bacterium]